KDLLFVGGGDASRRSRPECHCTPLAREDGPSSEQRGVGAGGYGESQATNVELQHLVIDAFNRRDLDAYLALADHDLEFTPYEVSVQGGQPYRGHAGVQSWWEETFEVLRDLKAEVYEVRDLGDRTF